MDRVVHLDADEVMHSDCEGETLNAALARLDAGGWNAANFDEFVFLPIEHDYVQEAPGDQPIAHYYFFRSPGAAPDAGLEESERLFLESEHGGHLLTGPDLRLAPEHLALRHYMVRSQEHAFVKYTTRVFAADDLERGWHQARLNQEADTFRFPPAAVLRRLPDVGQRSLDRTEPWNVHYWKLAAPRPTAAPSQVDVKAGIT